MRWWLRRIARKALVGELTRREVDHLVEEVFRRADRAGSPAQKGVGGRLMVRLTALTVSMFEVFLEGGHSEAEAMRRTRLVTAVAYERMTSVPTTAAWLLRRSSDRRVAMLLGWMRRFPFGPPAYEMRDVPTSPGVVGLDVLRCPTAAFMSERGLGEVCVQTWCALDYELAERLGVKLERSATLAEGAARCDFRFRTAGVR